MKQTDDNSGDKSPRDAIRSILALKDPSHDKSMIIGMPVAYVCGAEETSFTELEEGFIIVLCLKSCGRLGQFRRIQLGSNLAE